MKEYDFNFKDIVKFASDVIIVTKAHPINTPGPEIVYVNKAFTDLTFGIALMGDVNIQCVFRNKEEAIAWLLQKA